MHIYSDHTIYKYISKLQVHKTDKDSCPYEISSLVYLYIHANINSVSISFICNTESSDQLGCCYALPIMSRSHTSY